MDPTKIIESLKGLQSADTATRQLSEKTLNILSTHDQYSGALLNILRSSTDDRVKLPAAIALKESLRENDANIHEGLIQAVAANWRSKPIW